MQVIKEHKYGCSIETPKCPNCNKFFDNYGPNKWPFRIPLATGGFIYKKFFFMCLRCKKNRIDSIHEVSQEEVDILNKFSQDANLYNRIIFPPTRNLERMT